MLRYAPQRIAASCGMIVDRVPRDTSVDVIRDTHDKRATRGR